MKTNFVKQYTLTLSSCIAFFKNSNRKLLSRFNNLLMDPRLNFGKHECSTAPDLKDERWSLS